MDFIDTFVLGNRVLRDLIWGAIIFFCAVGAVRLIQKARTGERGSAWPTRGVWRSLAQNSLLAFMNKIFYVWAIVFFGWLTIDIWPHLGLTPLTPFEAWPLWASVLAAMVLFDFANYWSHRLLHRPWMWAFHSLHHSDEHMNFSTQSRIHVVEFIQMGMIWSILLSWLSLPVAAGFIAGTIRSMHSMYIHSNLPFDHGRFRKVVASPNYHRWHHADSAEVWGNNLADMFPLWDILFGTHHDPGRCDLPLGVSDAPDNVIDGQFYPVKRLYRQFREWQSARKAA